MVDHFFASDDIPKMLDPSVRPPSPRHTAIAEIQRDPDRFLDEYDLRRQHQGCRLNGRTPVLALPDAL